MTAEEYFIERYGGKTPQETNSDGDNFSPFELINFADGFLLSKNSNIDKITIHQSSVPTCGEGCCYDEELVISINDEEIKFDLANLYGLGSEGIANEILQSVLTKLKIKFEIKIC